MEDTDPTHNQQRRRKNILIVEIGALVVLVLINILPLIIDYAESFLGPEEDQTAVRDEQRIQDASIIQLSIRQYKIRNGFYPVSTQQAPFIDTSDTESGIWITNISEEFLPYISELNKKLDALPKDPLNKGGFIYQYKTTKPPAYDYELNIRLENDTENLSELDGGNNDKLYEVGTDLELID